jgi:hypothetical protein
MRSRTSRQTVLCVAAIALGGLVLTPAASAAHSKESSAPSKPTAITGGVGHVSGVTAVLQGSVNPHTLASAYYFQYGPTVAYGAKSAGGLLPAGTIAVKVSQSVSGLLPGYHYRLVATNANGTDFGRDRVFSIKKKNKKLAFNLPKTFEPVIYKHAFVFSGSLTGTGSANRSVVLQATPYPYTTPYTNVAGPISTGITGAFSFRVASLTTSTRFRVATVGSPSLVSKVVGEQVQAAITLKAQATHHKGVVRLYGTITPAAKGARVFFELEKKVKPKPPKLPKPTRPTKRPGGKSEGESEKAPSFTAKFSTVVKGSGKTVSHYSIVVTIHDSGRYRALVQVHPGPLVAGSSRVITLHAAPAKKKKGAKKKATTKKTTTKKTTNSGKKGKHAGAKKGKHAGKKKKKKG